MAVSRRQFLASVPAVAYGIAAAPEAVQTMRTKLSYGEYVRDSKGMSNFVPYSWDRIRAVAGLKTAGEGAFYARLKERYAELTGAYNNATGNPDFKKLFGLGRSTPFAPPTSDIPKRDLPAVMRMDEVLGGSTQRLRRLKKSISFGDGTWDSGINFADGNRVLTAYFESLPIRRPDGSFASSHENYLFVRQYAGGVGIYDASFYDGDMSHLVEEPDEHALLESIERNLGAHVYLWDLDERTLRDAQTWKREAERLAESEAVKRYLKDFEEAKKADGILDSVGFDHPYPVTAQPGDENSTFLRLSGNGIFQKGVHEVIEMPVDSPMAKHANYMDKRPYSRKFDSRDLPKEESRLLQEYFTNVASSMLQVDAIFSRV